VEIAEGGGGKKKQKYQKKNWDPQKGGKLNKGRRQKSLAGGRIKTIERGMGLPRSGTNVKSLERRVAGNQ